MIDYRLDFPLLSRRYKKKQLIYFDNAATSPKPEVVIKAVLKYYNFQGANIRRGPNFLAEDATKSFEEARIAVANFIKAKKEEIIFTSGATAGFNFIARTWAEKNLKKGDVVALSIAEHHANIVPWLQLKKKIGIVIKYIELDENYNFSASSLAEIFKDKRLKILSLTQASNVLGYYYDLKDIIKQARSLGVLTIIDAAQSIAHKPLDVKELGADIVIFSAHKMFAPSGVGVLYLRPEILKNLEPFFGGGGMIEEVKEQSFTTTDIPFRFEAGTPNIEGVIGLGAACKYLEKISWKKIEARELEITRYLLSLLDNYPFLNLLGGRDEKKRLPLFSFSFSKIHPHDVADLLGEEAIISRSGHHCAEPLHRYLKIGASLRLSLAFYNTKEEIDSFFKAMEKIKKILS